MDAIHRIQHDFTGKRLLIIGMGREGRSSAAFLRSVLPEAPLGIADARPQNEVREELPENIDPSSVTFHCGETYPDALADYDVIIRTPGIPPEKITRRMSERQELTSQADIYLRYAPGTIVGVTGTKGKGTTATMLHCMCKAAGRDTVLVGNIGTPALDHIAEVTEDTHTIFELSSHQLAHITTSPPYAVLLGIYPEHIDYHGSIEQYIAAKANITNHQDAGGTLVYDGENESTSRIARQSEARTVPVDTDILELVLPAEVQLEGILRQDAAAAATMAAELGISHENITAGLREFQPLQHRLERIETHKGIIFYNDSAATAPPATIGAIDTVPHPIGTLILGGFDRGLSFDSLARKIWEVSPHTLVLFPENGTRIWNAVQETRPAGAELPHTFLVQTMEDAVDTAFSHTQRGEVCLFSPAAPSFGLFEDYNDRGEAFRKAVHARTV